MDAVGGAHRFQGWNHNILTDSGGSVLPFNPLDKIREYIGLIEL